MKTIKQIYTIKAPIEKVWKALVDPEVIEEWGGGPAEMDEKEGTEFKLWGGDIYGKNLEVERNKKLVQSWFGGDWEEASKVSFLLSSDQEKTKVELIHENVPDEEADDIEDGWNRYYLGEIKKFLEE